MDDENSDNISVLSKCGGGKLTFVLNTIIINIIVILASASTLSAGDWIEN